MAATDLPDCGTEPSGASILQGALERTLCWAITRWCAWQVVDAFGWEEAKVDISADFRRTYEASLHLAVPTAIVVTLMASPGTVVLR